MGWEEQTPARRLSSWYRRFSEDSLTLRWTWWPGPTSRWGWPPRWPRRRTAWRSWRSRRWWSAGLWECTWSGFLPAIAWYVYNHFHLSTDFERQTPPKKTKVYLPSTTVTSTSLSSPRAMLVFLVKCQNYDIIEEIVLERSARLKLDPDRGDEGDKRVTGRDQKGDGGGGSDKWMVSKNQNGNLRWFLPLRHYGTNFQIFFYHTFFLLQLNPTYMKRILHLVPLKNIVLKSSYSCLKYWHSPAPAPAPASDC